MEKGLQVLNSFRRSLDQFQLQSIRVCGTEALRQGKNSHFFLQKAENILQHEIEIITGEEEARLSLAGALSGLQELSADTIFLVDVGGSSTEFIFTQSSTAETRIESIGLGVVTLTEKYLAPSRYSLAELDSELTDKIKSSLGKFNFLKKYHSVRTIGCGGTATSMAALALNLGSYKESLVHGHILKNDDLEKLWNRLIILSPEKRNELPCLEEGRGEILPAGIRIYQILLKLMQQDKMQVSDSGLLEGILLSTL
jgi:exopolyphosphatase/guanosine-5'-triphosphate,3'-diphosphate pyrophosphatase